MKHLIGAMALGAFVLAALPAAASDRGRHYRPDTDVRVSVVMVSPGVSFAFDYPGLWYAPHRDRQRPRHREWVPGHWEYPPLWVPGHWELRVDCDRDWRHEGRERHDHDGHYSGIRHRWR